MKGCSYFDGKADLHTIRGPAAGRFCGDPKVCFGSDAVCRSGRWIVGLVNAMLGVRADFGQKSSFYKLDRYRYEKVFLVSSLLLLAVHICDGGQQ